MPPSLLLYFSECLYCSVFCCRHHLYYFALCHRHPHFAEYCMYSYASSDTGAPTMMGHKQGFCIQSTNRVINARTTSFNSPYQNCSYQGVSVGYADNYNAGIPCQWVDITDALVYARSTGTSPTYMLSMHGNPENWLCEGVVSTFPNGSVQWEWTGNYTTNPPWPDVTPQPIDKFKVSGVRAREFFIKIDTLVYILYRFRHDSHVHTPVTLARVYSLAYNCIYTLLHAPAVQDESWRARQQHRHSFRALAETGRGHADAVLLCCPRRC